MCHGGPDEGYTMCFMDATMVCFMGCLMQATAV